MATPLADRKQKNEVAESLPALKNQAEAAIAQLSQVKDNLLNLKQVVDSEAIFDAEEQTEVQKVIVDLAVQIQTLLE